MENLEKGSGLRSMQTQDTHLLLLLDYGLTLVVSMILRDSLALAGGLKFAARQGSLLATRKVFERLPAKLPLRSQVVLPAS